MKLKELRMPIPRPIIAKSIKHSFLHKKSSGKAEIDNSLRIYPLPATYIRGIDGSFSFLYVKNDVINYYAHNKGIMKYNLIPVYNYKSNKYDVIATDFPYSFSDKSGEAMVVVRTPNNKYYIAGIVQEYQNIKQDRLVVLNVESESLLYAGSANLKGKLNRVRHSMPIANSFIVVLTTSPTKIAIYVIDLINEKTDEIYYDLELHKTKILRFSKDSKITHVEMLNFGYNIDRDSRGTVFYQKYYIDISLYIDKRFGGDISLTASYQNLELEVVLKVSEEINIVRRYAIDAKLDLSTSHLYSVIVTSGEYTLLKSARVSHQAELYYKTEPQNTHININLGFKINRHEDISIIEADSKYFVVFNRLKTYKIPSQNWYHVLLEDAEIKILVLHRMASLMTKVSDGIHNNAIVFDEKMQEVKVMRLDVFLINLVALNLEKYLEDKCVPNHTDVMAKVDLYNNKFYILFWSYCSSHKKYYFTLFECSISDILKGPHYFRLMWLFGVDARPLFYHDSSYRYNVKRLYAYTRIKHSYFAESLLTMFDNNMNKISTIYDGIFLGGLYDSSRYYHDLKFNRKSINIAKVFNEDSRPVVCDLKIVEEFIPMFWRRIFNKRTAQP
jgi:hypothetical protein